MGGGDRGLYKKSIFRLYQTHNEQDDLVSANNINANNVCIVFYVNIIQDRAVVLSHK